MRIYFFVTSFFILFSNLSAASNGPSTCEQTDKLLYLIKKLHYQSPEFNGAFASQAIENYVYAVDGNHYFLYAKDISQLKEIQKIEKDTREVFCKSFSYLLSVYERRLKETDSIVNAGLTKKYIWKKNDS